MSRILGPTTRDARRRIHDAGPKRGGRLNTRDQVAYGPPVLAQRAIVVGAIVVAVLGAALYAVAQSIAVKLDAINADIGS